MAPEEEPEKNEEKKLDSLALGWVLGVVMRDRESVLVDRDKDKGLYRDFLVAVRSPLCMRRWS